MKVTYRKYEGRSKEATMIERSLKSLIKKYGVDIVKHVSNRIFAKDLRERKLTNEIKIAKEKLEELENMQA